jgi:hypothetical protein
MDEVTANQVILGLDLQLKTCPICRKFEKEPYLAVYLQTTNKVLQYELDELFAVVGHQETLWQEPESTPASRIVRRVRPTGFRVNTKAKILCLCEQFVTLAEYVPTSALNKIFRTLGHLVRSGAFGRLWNDGSRRTPVTPVDRVRVRVAAVWNRFEQEKRGSVRFGTNHLKESTLATVDNLYTKYNLTEEARNAVVYLVLCELVWRGAFGIAASAEKFDSPKPKPNTVLYSTELVGLGVSISLPPSLQIYLDQYWFRVPVAQSRRCAPVVCPFSGCGKQLQSGTAWMRHIAKNHGRDILCPWCRKTVTVKSMVHLSFRHHICDAMIARFLSDQNEPT